MKVDEDGGSLRSFDNLGAGPASSARDLAAQDRRVSSQSPEEVGVLKSIQAPPGKQTFGLQ